MGYSRLRAKYGYPADWTDEQVVLTTRKRPEFAAQSNEDFAQGVDAYEAQGGAAAPGMAGRATPVAQPTAPSQKVPDWLYMAERANPTWGMASRAGRAIAEFGGPVKAAERMGRHGAKSLSELVTGIGLLPAGIAHAGSLGLRNFARAVGLPESVDPTLTAETQQAGKSALNVAKQVPGQVLGDFQRLSENPVREIIDNPVNALLNLGLIADAPAIGAKALARGAARVGATETAKGAEAFAEAAKPWNVVRKTAKGAFPELAARSEAIGNARDIVSRARKAGAAVAEPIQEKIDNLVARMGHGGDEAARAELQGLAEPVRQTPEYEAAIKGYGDPTNEGKAAFLGGYKESLGEETAKRFARGELNPDIVERRARQPQRITFGGTEELEQAPRRALPTEGLERRIAKLQRLIKQTAPKAAKRQELQAELDALRVERKAASKAERAYTVARAKEAETGRAMTPLEELRTKIAEMEASGPTIPTAKKIGAAQEKERASLRALIRSGELFEKAQAADATRKPVVPIMSKIGTARGRLNVANAAERRLPRLVGSLSSAEDQLERIRGVIPTDYQRDFVTGALKARGDLPTPSYVPGLPKKPSIRQMIGNLRAPKGEAPKAGFLRRATGQTFVKGEQEPRASKLWATHASMSIKNDENLQIIREAKTMPGAREVKSPADVDYTKESLLAPGMYERNVSQKIAEGGPHLENALASGDPEKYLNDAVRGSIAKNEGEAARMNGPFYAIPKHAAREFSGQMATTPLWARVVFDNPAEFQRWAVLTLRPAFYVNNLVGGAGLAAVGGAEAQDFIAAATKGVREAAPKELRGSGFAAVEAPTTGAPGLRQKIAKVSAQANEEMDEYFRRALHHKAVREAVTVKSLKETGRLPGKMDYIERMEALGPEGVDEAVKYVNRFINDYTRQSPVQRNILRKVFPFQSFTVHMARLASRLPLQHPARARILTAAAQMADEYRDDRFKEAGFPDVPKYRGAQLPIVQMPDRSMVTIGTGGFNPMSAFNQMTETTADPGLAPGAVAMAAGQTSPVLRALADQTGRQAGTGREFSSPEVYEEFGGRKWRLNPETQQAEPVNRVAPNLGDIARSQVPQLSLLERLLQPNETYDLWGGPMGFGGPVERKDFMAGPRRYSGAEALAGYLGVPLRSFQPEELQPSKAKKDAQAEATRKLLEMLRQQRERELVSPLGPGMRYNPETGRFERVQ